MMSFETHMDLHMISYVYGKNKSVKKTYNNCLKIRLHNFFLRIVETTTYP